MMVDRVFVHHGAMSGVSLLNLDASRMRCRWSTAADPLPKAVTRSGKTFFRARDKVRRRELPLSPVEG